MNLADRDIYLIHIENEIQIRRKKLLEKQKKIHAITKQNQFLELVKQLISKTEILTEFFNVVFDKTIFKSNSDKHFLK